MLRLLENPGVTAILGLLTGALTSLWAENRRWKREDRTRYHQDRMTLYIAYAKESAKFLAFTNWPETEKEQAQAREPFEQMKNLYQEIVLLAASTEVAQAAFDVHQATYESLSWKQHFSDSREKGAISRSVFIKAARKELGLNSLEFAKHKDLDQRPEPSI